ncbi:hypothetical protein [Mycobacterium spongiae]|uniref:Uncharacterized protein n=1 Tax=Mycobacterium spongiae TaxID=886343 RepID=A0A975K1S0_9MYCO|nr:hypothetical protein [Mycobacterium spongiae]QUR69365.1 hypothetical protein F6B93_21885 [Mycobacterium spongiae]
MSSARRRWTAIAALTCAAIGVLLAPATALAEPHNVTYIAKINGIGVPGRATFMVNEKYTSAAPLSATGREFMTTTMLADASKAGLQVRIPPPYSANLHCEISVDGQVAELVDQFVTAVPYSPDPMNGILSCGASPLPQPEYYAKICAWWWCCDLSCPPRESG